MSVGETCPQFSFYPEQTGSHETAEKEVEKSER